MTDIDLTEIEAIIAEKTDTNRDQNEKLDCTVLYKQKDCLWKI